MPRPRALWPLTPLPCPPTLPSTQLACHPPASAGPPSVCPPSPPSLAPQVTPPPPTHTPLPTQARTALFAAVGLDPATGAYTQCRPGGGASAHAGRVRVGSVVGGAGGGVVLRGFTGSGASTGALGIADPLKWVAVCACICVRVCACHTVAFVLLRPAWAHCRPAQVGGWGCGCGCLCVCVHCMPCVWVRWTLRAHSSGWLCVRARAATCASPRVAWLACNAASTPQRWARLCRT